ncbi:MAG: glycosyltransferase family A protein [Candidatus Micrarchaeaceae archaeon]
MIPVSSDPKIEECINCINSNKYKVEIIVALNAPDLKTAELLDEISKNNKSVRRIFIKKKGIGRARDLGCKAAKGKFLMMMDSDCIMKKGSLDLLIDGLSNTDLSKGDVKYLSNDFSTKLIAKVRQGNASNLNNLYTPMIAFRKSIVKKIGGYYFSHNLQWAEDGEFAERAKRVKLTLKKVPSAIAYHKPTSISQDISTAFKYGFGFGIALRSGLRYGDPVHGRGKTAIEGIKSDIEGTKDRITYISNYFKQGGFIIGIYRSTWFVLYQFGRYSSYFSKT